MIPIINKLKIIFLCLFLCSSCKVNPQIFSYGEECEKANSIELAKAVLRSVDENRIYEILDTYFLDFKYLIKAYITIDNGGNIMSVKVTTHANDLTTKEIEEITKYLYDSDFKFKSCVHDNYFDTNEDELLRRAAKNYKGGKVSVYVRFPGDLFKGEENRREVLTEIKKGIK